MRRPAPGLLGLTVATACSAALGFVVLIIAGRVLGAAAYAGYAAVGAFYYLFAGVGAAVQQETVLALDGGGNEPRSRPLWGSLIVATTAAVIALGWAHVVIPGPLSADLTMGVGVAGLIVFCALSGALAAQRYWGWLIVLIISEGALRAALAGPLLIQYSGATVIVFVVVCGPLVTVGFLLRPRFRKFLVARGGVSAGAFISRLSKTMLATIAAALVGAGFPFVVATTARDQLGADAGSLFAALTLSRSPILLLMNGVRQRVLVTLADGSAHPRRSAGALARRAGAVLAVSALGGAIGPGLLKFCYGPEFLVPGWLMGLFVLSGVLLAAQTYFGWLLAVHGRHSLATSSWLTTLALTIVLCVMPLGLEMRVALAVVFAPAVGVCTQLFARPSRKPLRADRVRHSG